MPRKRSVSEKIALFEGKLTTSKSASPLRILRTDLPREQRTEQNLHSRTSQITEVRKTTERVSSILERVNSTKIETVTQRIENNVEHNSEHEAKDIQKRIEELLNAKIKYGRVESMPTFELSNGMAMPVLSVGTALLDPRLAHNIVTAAIDLGYRAIDCAFVYGNEKVVGDAIRAKIADGTVTREDLFITNKLWSTYHRTDLVETACKASLEAMGLDYFDLYLIHNPMSFKEGGDLIPKIASVLQYSSHDYLDAWYGMEALVAKGLVRAIGVSNFNSVQLQRVLDKGRIKPVVNQVESHPYLSQQKLELFCGERNIALMCYGVLGSKGTPVTYRSEVPDAIDDPLVIVMASGLGITPAQLLISYQLASHRSVTVKASSARRLHENLLALRTDLTPVEVDALSALNKNRRTYAFRGMGDTHRNYPFNVAF